jgi:ribonuclease HI
MWVIWCARNNLLFNGESESVSNNVAKIHSLMMFCGSAFDTHLLDTGQPTNIRHISWSRPAEGTVCLNVDGSRLGSVRTAGFGGLLHNNTGEFLGGFYGTAARPNVLYAEIMAIHHGLEFCWNKGFRNVVCYSDSLQAVTLVKEGVSPFHSFANELQKICQLRSRDWTVLFEHTFREGNRCADHLAKLGAASNSSLVIISVPPLELTSLLQADAEGVAIVRV